MKPVPHAPCPQCGELRTVENKLLATNLCTGEPFTEAFQVNDPQKFHDSPHTDGEYFIDALFCRACAIAFIPDSIAGDMGIVPSFLKGTLRPSRPFGLSAYGNPSSRVSTHFEQAPPTAHTET